MQKTCLAVLTRTTFVLVLILKDLRTRPKVVLRATCRLLPRSVTHCTLIHPNNIFSIQLDADNVGLLTPGRTCHIRTLHVGEPWQSRVVLQVRVN